MPPFFRPDLHRGLRYARTADEAFRTARYGACIELPRPSLWKRICDIFRSKA